MKRLIVAAALMAGCTDPRARPVPPVVQLQFPTGLTITSPGTIPHTVYAFDPDGLGTVRVEVISSDPALHVDSILVPPELNETNLSYTWQVPAGIATGTSVTVRATVTDLIGLVAVDTALFAVQDSAAAIH